MKKRPDESSNPSKKKSSFKPTSNDLKSLDEKWSQRFVQLEAILLPRSFAVSLEPGKKPPTVVTSDQPLSDPGVGTSQMSVGVATKVTGFKPLQATGEAASMTATRLLRISVREGLMLPARLLSALLRVLVVIREC